MGIVCALRVVGGTRVRARAFTCGGRSHALVHISIGVSVHEHTLHITYTQPQLVVVVQRQLCVVAAPAHAYARTHARSVEG